MQVFAYFCIDFFGKVIVMELIAYERRALGSEKMGQERNLSCFIWNI
jgi:hypothetical protein